jgi:hypothetical protein
VAVHIAEVEAASTSIIAHSVPYSSPRHEYQAFIITSKIRLTCSLYSAK